MRPRIAAVLALAALALLPLLAGVALAQSPPTLVVTGYGGRWSEVMKRSLTEPFEKKYNCKVEIVTGITTEWVAKLMAAGPDNPPFDVIVGNEPPLPIPRERGFFDKRNEAAAPNVKSIYPKALVGDTGVVLFWSRIGLAYRTDLVKSPPRAWKDFWSDEFTGKRGAYTITNTLGINFLFMANKIHGKDYFDMDAGVPAVKRLAPKFVDFTGTMEKLLEQKEVAVAVLHDGSAWDLAKRGLPVSWVAPAEGVPILDQVAHVTRGSKQKELAWKFVNEYLTPEVQLAYATELFFSPTNRNVKLPAEVAAKIISGPKDVDSLVIFDWSQIVKQRPAWTERWNREIR
jgi:putative spermidine/putrescine transport system substrate-binding protein